MRLCCPVLSNYGLCSSSTALIILLNNINVTSSIVHILWPSEFEVRIHMWLRHKSINFECLYMISIFRLQQFISNLFTHLAGQIFLRNRPLCVSFLEIV